MSDAAMVDDRVMAGPLPPRPDGATAETDPLMTRLRARIDWYDRNALRSQRLFKAFKVFTLLAASVIPFVSGLGAANVGMPQQAPLIAGVLGAAIVVVEGLQQLFQWQQNWLSYRSTCEALEREQSLYLARAGSYADAQDAHALLAERVEGIMAQEHTKWLALSEQGGARRPNAVEAPGQARGQAQP